MGHKINISLAICGMIMMISGVATGMIVGIKKANGDHLQYGKKVKVECNIDGIIIEGTCFKIVNEKYEILEGISSVLLFGGFILLFCGFILKIGEVGE